MTEPARIAPGAPADPSPRPVLLLLVGFAGAVAVRVAVGGPGVAQSGGAGLLFAGLLLVLCLLGRHFDTGRRPWPMTRRAVVIGVAAGAFLCLPAVVGGVRTATGLGGHRPGGSFGTWALIVAVVACAEELFLRGVLYDALARWRGEGLAILAAAVAFAALHVPLYGWHVLPLDLAVGLWLGALRRVANSPVAPALAHTLADLVGWWLR